MAVGRDRRGLWPPSRFDTLERLGSSLGRLALNRPLSALSAPSRIVAFGNFSRLTLSPKLANLFLVSPLRHKFYLLHSVPGPPYASIPRGGVRLRDQEMELRDFSNLQGEMATLKVIKTDLVTRLATVSGNLEVG